MEPIKPAFVLRRREALRLAMACCLLLAVAALVVRAAGAAAPAAGGSAEPPRPQQISYSYDAAGRLVRAEYGDGKSIVYTYDAAGNLLRRSLAQRMPAYLPIVLKAQ